MLCRLHNNPAPRSRQAPVPAETREPVSVGQEAVKSGTLTAARLANFHPLAREMAFEQEKAETGLVRSERKRWKGIAKSANEIIRGVSGNRGRFLLRSCYGEQTPRVFNEGGTRSMVWGRSAF